MHFYISLSAYNVTQNLQERLFFNKMKSQTQMPGERILFIHASCLPALIKSVVSRRHRALHVRSVDPLVHTL